MARDHHQRNHPDSTSASLIRYNYNVDSLSNLLDSRGISKRTQQKISKDAMVGGGEGRHGRHSNKKKGRDNNDDEEDYYYTYDVAYEADTQSSKIATFFFKAWGFGTTTTTGTDHEHEPSPHDDHDYFLRGTMGGRRHGRRRQLGLQ
jgi:hypothetical protein